MDKDPYDVFVEKISFGMKKYNAEIGQELIGEVSGTIAKHRTDENDKLLSSISQDVLAVIDERLGVTDYLFNLPKRTKWARRDDN